MIVEFSTRHCNIVSNVIPQQILNLLFLPQRCEFYFDQFPHILISAIDSCILTERISDSKKLLEQLLFTDSLCVFIANAKVAAANKDYEG